MRRSFEQRSESGLVKQLLVPLSRCHMSLVKVFVRKGFRGTWGFQEAIKGDTDRFGHSRGWVEYQNILMYMDFGTSIYQN